jgi:flavin-dependent dehydrogenase
MEYYDVVVIGSGPAGQKAAIQGAKLEQRVVVTEQDVRIGAPVYTMAPFQARRCARARSPL